MSWRRFPVLVMIVAICSCTGATTGDGFELDEFSIDGPVRLEAGRDALAVANHGMYPHTLVVTDGSGGVVAATSLVQPGETASLDVDLAPGEYSFTCRIVTEAPDGNIVDHYEAGMHLLVEVAG